VLPAPSVSSARAAPGPQKKYKVVPGLSGATPNTARPSARNCSTAGGRRRRPHRVRVEARRVLLNVLDALRPHLDAAVVVVGAQAVYLRTAGRLAGYQPFTTDADVVHDPGLLADISACPGESSKCGKYLLAWRCTLTAVGLTSRATQAAK
jgi:hypothetical protein